MYMPNLDAQRAAMKKLSFLIGEWSGEATVLRGPAQFVNVAQTEHAQFKLDGLILMIEGVWQDKIR
jgi:hypothetical protein